MFKTKPSDGGVAEEENVFSSTDVSRLSGVSLRQLQWWDEQKVVSPRHEGHRRLYALKDLVQVSVIAELRKKGFSLQKIRRVLRFLQKEMGRRLADVMHSTAPMHLVTDGKSIYLDDNQDRIIDIFKNSRQPMFLVCVSDQVRRLDHSERKPVRMEPGILTRRMRSIG